MIWSCLIDVVEFGLCVVGVCIEPFLTAEGVYFLFEGAVPLDEVAPGGWTWAPDAEVEH